jgi:hypothetical protein
MKYILCTLFGLVMGFCCGFLLGRFIANNNTKEVIKEVPKEVIIETRDTILVKQKALTKIDTFYIEGKEIIKQRTDTIIDTFYVPIDRKEYEQTISNKDGDFKIGIDYSGAYSSINNVTLQSKIKPKRWNIGVQGGVGVGYDLLHNNITAGPYIGIGVSYGFNF